MESIHIEITSVAEKQIRKLPREIILSLNAWIDRMEQIGYVATKAIRGFHDEALKGDRQGQRSVRLNRAYRVIYRTETDGTLRVLEVIEINKHKY